MNSSQLNFFILQEDCPGVEAFFIQHSVKILKYKINRNEPYLSEDLPMMNDRVQYKVGLTHSDFMEKISYRHNEHSDIYELDTLQSFGIEFYTGGFYPYDINALQRARFYCVNSYYGESGELVKKSDDLKKWTQTLYRLFKRTFLVKLEESPSIWASRKVIDWISDADAKMDRGAVSISARKI